MKRSRAEITSIYKSVEPYINHTPLLSNEWLNNEIDADIYLKCENLQKIGSFKARGVFRAILQLSKKEQSKGVATHSSGNHAQALAKAAKVFGLKAWIVMPENSPKIKIEGVKELGAEVILCPSTFDDREKALELVIQKTGATFIPPFDHKSVIEGQSTCAYEILNDLDGVNVIMMPIGGGGLAAGTCIAVQAMKPDISIYGAEPGNMDDAYRSLKSGMPEKNSSGLTTVADGLRTNVGAITLGVMKDHLEEILRVDEDDIIPAMEMVWKRFKIIIEPSCAVPVAALLKNKELFKGKKVVIIITGGNVDLEDVPFYS